MSIFIELSKFNGPFNEDKYNQFFNPNLCHVCKSPNDGKLIPCDRCNSIYYCCEEHKTMHAESHQTVCGVIALAISFDPNWYNRRCYFEEWMDLQKSLIIFIKMHISRRLYRYEAEMCLCAKSCYVCHRRINLQPCTYCYSINYCDEHIEPFRTHVMCQYLMVLLNLNIANINNSICNEYPEYQKFVFPKKQEYYDMISFINMYIRNSNQHAWPNQLYIFTDYVTGPLTLYNALEEADLLNNPRKLCVYVIHIIGGNIIDVIGLKAWEILLHLLQNIRKLYIVMISPEMVFESAEYDNLCHECISCSQKLYFDFVSESYNNYLKMESYKFPNIIVGFEAKISVKYLSSKFLSEVLVSLSTVNCPLLLTAKSHKNVKEIIYILGKIYHNNKLYITKKNDFSSCRPNRDYSNGEIIFRNSYFIIYK